MSYIVPVGRVCFSVIFLGAFFAHFSPQTIGFAAQQGVPLPSVLVPLSGVIAGAGA